MNQPVGWLWREFEDGQRWRAPRGTGPSVPTGREQARDVEVRRPPRLTSPGGQSITSAWAARYARDKERVRRRSTEKSRIFWEARVEESGTRVAAPASRWLSSARGHFGGTAHGKNSKNAAGSAGDSRRPIAGGKDETTLPEVPVLRIFLSSPGDVAEERSLARELIDSVLPKLAHLRECVKLELVAWDDPAARIPMLATETPQDSVNAARPRPATCDIVIVILWSRMGTPLPDSIRKPNGEPYLSGTEWEYEDAVNSPREPRPEVLVYRRTEEPKIGLRDPQKEGKGRAIRAGRGVLRTVPQCRRLIEGRRQRIRDAAGIQGAAAPAPGGNTLSAPAAFLARRQSEADDRHRPVGVSRVAGARLC